MCRGRGGGERGGGDSRLSEGGRRPRRSGAPRREEKDQLKKALRSTSKDGERRSGRDWVLVPSGKKLMQALSGQCVGGKSGKRLVKKRG